MSDELHDFLTNARRYFAQQHDLFGNIIYSDDDVKRKKKVSAKDMVEAAKGPIYPDEPWAQSTTVQELYEQIHECVKCPLGNTRTTFVYGTGNAKSKVMFIGEAPGADEDAQGEPFVGRAGQLLNKIIEAVDMKREDVYICNIIKCRPPNNRAPLPLEVETCTPYLLKQIELIKPAFIILLGRTAAQWLLHTNDSLGALRGKAHNYNGIKVIVTYHPAALLRNPDWKRPTWEDMKMFKKLYDEEVKA
ncbi:MAG: uracil-DNA glycosylase [Ignavibacteriae bacterium]|nr:uracil-DNA glycosylase [Ignavibacteria bacterium]MBI3364414.1 uracil-DNA glycosylase [Ignavibacteriota bacterium]